MNNIGIILAAGKGSRMKSFIPKPFQILGGEYLLDHVINSFKKSGIEKIFIVVSPEISSMAEISDYGKKTASPNARYPMAAFAGALGTKFEKLEHYSLGTGEYEITSKKS